MTEHLDSSDLDALESLVLSEGWLCVAARVMRVIEDKRNELEYRAHTEIRGAGSVEALQGFLAACRMFLNLPATLTAEIKSELEK
jgi:hypothetical protein